MENVEENGGTNTRPCYDLEERLLQYSAMIVRLVESLSATLAGNHIGGQLLRSGTSPLFNHGEAQAAESQEDFIHKMSVCLKELRESGRAIRLIMTIPLVQKRDDAQAALIETEELVRIFVASIRTARKNKVKEDGPEYLVGERRPTEQETKRDGRKRPTSNGERLLRSMFDGTLSIDRGLSAFPFSMFDLSRRTVFAKADVQCSMFSELRRLR